MSETSSEPQRVRSAGSHWSFRIATIAGIPVRIHFTFLFLLAYIAYVGNSSTDSGWQLWVGFALLVFLCVVLHEFGHALTARAYGIQTRDITLYPIGGVAVFEGRMRANQEFWIALAGPFVNVVLALLLAGGLVLTRGAVPWADSDMLSQGILPALFYANVGLAIFNLIPAFPMDGGRVLRAFLGMRMSEVKATTIAGFIGQALAVMLGLAGLFGTFFNPVWALIAIFIYLGAGQEMAAMNTRSLLEGCRVGEAMQTRFRTIESGATLDSAAEMLLAGSQQDFPVLAGEEVVGILTRTKLVTGLAREGSSAYVAGHMEREFQTVSPDMLLDDAVEFFSSSESPPVLVKNEDAVVGLLTQENFTEFIMLRSALRRNQP
jgi:Zn-dependent protease/predicted transcriptional regulator